MGHLALNRLVVLVNMVQWRPGVGRGREREGPFEGMQVPRGEDTGPCSWGTKPIGDVAYLDRFQIDDQPQMDLEDETKRALPMEEHDIMRSTRATIVQ